MPSSRIPLYVISHTNDEGMKIIRVVAYVGLLKNDGKLFKTAAIVDIGAPVSVIPFSVWSWCPVELGKQRFIQLSSGREECDLEVYEGEVTIALLGIHLKRDTGRRGDSHFRSDCHLCVPPPVGALHLKPLKAGHGG